MNAADLKFWKSGWWAADSHRRSRTAILAAFGLGPNAKLPASAPEIQYRGAYVKIVEKHPGKNPRYQHRLIVTCPLCGLEVPFGRIHQHIDTKTCQMGRQPTSEILNVHD